MAFKLGKETRERSVVRKRLKGGVLGEANKDGSIYVDKSVPANSERYKTILDHEGQHADDMKAGVLDYGDDWVRYKSKTYHRRDGKIKYNGQWHIEGSDVFPWEKKAIKAEKPKQQKRKITNGRPQVSAFQKNK